MLEIGKNLLEISKNIKALAKTSSSKLPPHEDAHKIASKRVIRPIDYMRCAEFDAVLRNLKIKPKMRILDVSSPQWFTLYLAAKYPETEFIYINITDDQVSPFNKIAGSLGISNLTYSIGDVRKLDFDKNAFDKVISISVLEHIYPELGGDVDALLEIKRVLKPDGELLVTVPYKAKHNVVYKNGAVYERGENTRNFYAREYDKETFDKLIESCQFAFEKELFICEKRGLLSKDFYQFGPGKSKWFSKYLIKSLHLSERILKLPFDEALAKRYLEVSENKNHRLVNVFALLKKVAV